MSEAQSAYSSFTISAFVTYVESSVDMMFLVECICLALISQAILVRMIRQRKTKKPVSEENHKTPKENTPSVQGERAIRKLIYSLFDKVHRDASDVFTLYDDMTRQRKINFRHYVQDESRVQALFALLLTHAINTARTDWVNRVMKDMRAMEVPRSIAFYASLMKAFAQRGQFREELQLYQSILQDGLQPDGMMYVCLMNAALSHGDSKKARFFFTELTKVETPSMRTCMTILRTYANEKDWKAACDILKVMKDSGTPPDNLAFNNVLGVCVRAGQVGVAHELVSEWQDQKDLLDVVSFNTLLKGYTKLPNYSKAEAVLEQMQKIGVQPNLISFNTAMDCAVRSVGNLMNSNDRDNSAAGCRDLAQKPWELVARMEAAGLAPDRYTCSTLIKGVHLSGCSVHEIDKAISILKNLGSEGLQCVDNDNARLAEVLFNTMLDACVNIRDLNRMIGVFTMMREYNVPISAVTFGTLIKAFSQAGKLQRCRTVWDEMRKATVKPTPVTYGCYIDACIRNGELDEAFVVFKEMGADGCKPNAVIYNSLLRGYSRAKQPLRALELYKDMKEKGVECSSCIFHVVLEVIARYIPGSTDLTSVFEDMRKARVKIDAVTFSILVKGSAAANNLGGALEIFNQAVQAGVVLDELAINTILNACAKKGDIDHAQGVLETMQKLGMRPSNVTYSILMKMYGKAKCLDKAFGVLDMLKKQNSESPNLWVYTCLIQACVQNMQIKRACDVFHDMENEGIEPDSVAYGALIHGCVYTNRFDLAMSYFRRAYLVEKSPAKLQTGASSKAVVSLQPEVLNALLSALNRKGKFEQSTEVEHLMQRHGVAFDNKAQVKK
jgi:pentatricopeptide repeat protein